MDLTKKPLEVLSSESPDGLHRAYVTDNPAFDPPIYTLFIARNGTEEFRLVSELPEDIEYIQQITWSPDGRNVVFQSNGTFLLPMLPGLTQQRSASKMIVGGGMGTGGLFLLQSGLF